MNVDYLSRLPVDIFIKEITYLPFDNVITICTSNKTLHNYCANPDYNNNWKQLIDNTFGNIHGYQEKLKEIRNGLNLGEGTYNYLVYTHLVKVLDPITQLMIYYRQGDIKSFDSSEFWNAQRFLALFLLGKRNELEEKFSRSGRYRFHAQLYYPSFINMLKGGETKQATLDEMLGTMALEGSIQGIRYLTDRGANIHGNNEYAVQIAAKMGHLEVIKYLVNNGADISTYADRMLKSARNYGHSEVVEYIESVINK